MNGGKQIFSFKSSLYKCDCSSYLVCYICKTGRIHYETCGRFSSLKCKAHYVMLVPQCACTCMMLSDGL